MTLPLSPNLVWHHATVTRSRREEQNGHRGVILWFTGLSGAGKSTLAHTVEEELHQRGCRTFVLDGDNVRHGLSGDLGFSPIERVENIRRVGEVAKLFIEAGVIVLTAFISPYRADRERVRGMVAHGDFLEIYCDSPVEVCESRDVKGLYKKARAGLIPSRRSFTPKARPMRKAGISGHPIQMPGRCSGSSSNSPPNGAKAHHGKSTQMRVRTKPSTSSSTAPKPAPAWVGIRAGTCRLRSRALYAGTSRCFWATICNRCRCNKSPITRRAIRIDGPLPTL